MKKENKMKDLKKYQKYLEKQAKLFRLTADDLSNLTDLGMMIPGWLVKDVLKPNKMEKWFWNFFERIEEITLPEIKKKEAKK